MSKDFTTGHAAFVPHESTLADKLRARGVGEATIRLNAPITKWEDTAPAFTAAPKRIRQSSKPLLNKLETEWLAVLQKNYPGDVFHAQAWRVKLCNGAWFKVDFCAVIDGQWTAWEVKGNAGKNIDRGKLALKVAAGLWPQVEWHLCWKANGEWVTQEILS